MVSRVIRSCLPYQQVVGVGQLVSHVLLQNSGAFAQGDQYGVGYAGFVG
jgi:hypothetical protein